VRSQLASTAKRLPAADGLPIITRLLSRNQDEEDPHIALLLWWAVEQHATAAMDEVVKTFTAPPAWQTPLIDHIILERLMRRYAAEGTAPASEACARLLMAAPTAGQRSRLLAALEQGLQEGPQEPAGAGTGSLFGTFAAAEKRQENQEKRTVCVSPGLCKALARLWTEDAVDPSLIRILTRLGDVPARGRALALATAPVTRPPLRESMLQVLSETGDSRCVEPLLNVLKGKNQEAFKLAALGMLQRFDADEIGEALLALYPQCSGQTRARIIDTLLGRKRWALAFLWRVESGQIAPTEVTVEQLRGVALYRDS